jgi:hypothetical protein
MDNKSMAVTCGSWNSRPARTGGGGGLFDVPPITYDAALGTFRTPAPDSCPLSQLFVDVPVLEPLYTRTEKYFNALPFATFAVNYWNIALIICAACKCGSTTVGGVLLAVSDPYRQAVVRRDSRAMCWRAWLRMCAAHPKRQTIDPICTACRWPATAADLLFCYWGQKLMMDRPAFGLKRLLAQWNLLLAVFSTIGFLRTAPHLLYYLYTRGFYASVRTVAAHAAPLHRTAVRCAGETSLRRPANPGSSTLAAGAP